MARKNTKWRLHKDFFCPNKNAYFGEDYLTCTYMKHSLRIALSLSFILTLGGVASAQDDLDQFLSGSVEDGEKLIEAYIAPFMKSVSLGLNQGWYNTAKPHKIAGIDITVTANAMAVPASDRFFDATKLGLQELQLDQSSPYYPNMPTIVGPEDESYLRVSTDQGFSETIEVPGGIDLKKNIGMNSVPVPMANVGIGLVKGTDLKVRFTPTIDLGDNGSLKLLGFGVMHDVKQWIPGLKLMPFDLSGFIGYTKLKLDTYFDPETNPDQYALFEASGLTVQGIISKKFSVLTLYGALGYNSASTNLALKGEYDVNDDGQISENERNPISMKSQASGLRGTAGMRLKLAILTLHADYTVQKYNCLTVGVGLSIR